MKHLYIVRHAKAEGQPPEAKLTALGEEQARSLADFFEGRKIDALYSSPFLRARKTIEPLAEKRGVPIIEDARLGERILSGTDLDDWMMHLEKSFEDYEYLLEGGESNRTAYERASAFLEEILESDDDYVAVVSHGNLTTLLLRYFDDRFGYHELMKLSNPDVFHVSFEEGEPSVERIWSE
ncbi:histidine phosphatase family protein [Rossellomorea vietnamensis]|uniref:Histidine phosphatase family protein n=1 Tax=Rossellomorea vietnamensis TaxID=218284 RepID=A0A5D4P023_9BACI|nr:histidine phosphatase family protein [Rossellomorea vietnamensis]TYS19034.1 histidine phosphatase family protein [Rossellomorea vietnamensis]